MICIHCGSQNTYKEEGILQNTYKCRQCGRDIKKEETGLTTTVKVAGVVLAVIGLKDKLGPKK